MEWAQLIIFLIGVFGLFIWNRAEGRADARHLQSMLESNRNLIDAIREDGAIFRQKVADESREFHGRLVAIEERKLSLYGQEIRLSSKREP